MAVMNVRKMSSLEANITSAPAVLVVDDEVLVRMVIADYLRDCGYRVVEADSGDEAMEILTTVDFAIDAVFSDVQMPGEIDGFALALWLRRERPEIRVMLTSGVARACDAARALCEDGPLLEKPYHTADVERRLRTLLARKA